MRREHWLAVNVQGEGLSCSCSCGGQTPPDKKALHPPGRSPEGPVIGSWLHPWHLLTFSPFRCALSRLATWSSSSSLATSAAEFTAHGWSAWGVCCWRWERSWSRCPTSYQTPTNTLLLAPVSASTLISLSCPGTNPSPVGLGWVTGAYPKRGVVSGTHTI